MIPGLKNITHLPKAQRHCLYGSSLTFHVFAKENANTILSIFEIKDMSQPYNSNKNMVIKKDQNTMSTEPNKMSSWLVNLLILTKIQQNYQNLTQNTAPY